MAAEKHSVAASTADEELSISSEPPTPAANPPAPPDGGLKAWMQCAAGFCIFFNTWGLLNTFGAFQAYYKQTILSSSPVSDLSWIGTVQSSFIMLGALYSAPLYDLGHLRPLIAVGSFCVVFGMFMTSLCHEYWQFLLVQGFLMGIGVGCLFVPTTAILATWFARRRGLAMGIATSGSALGGIIYPIVFYRLVGLVGFGWTTRIMAFMMIALSLLPVFGMRMIMKPPGIRRMFDRNILKEADYVIFTVAMFFGYMGLYIPYFYIQLYCTEGSILTGELNFYLLAIINAGGFFGRIIIGGVADKIGPMNAFLFDSAACTVVLFGWMGIYNGGGVIVFCLLYGFLSAGIITLPATIIAVSMCPDMRQYGVRMMMPMVPISIGLLIGNPIAGALLPHGWKALQAFSAVSLLLCTAIAFTARVVKVGFGVRAKC